MIRIVKMTFRVQHINDFEQLFKALKQKIRACEGCTSLNLLQDKNDARIFFTYSHWQDEIFLEKYRTSKLFEVTWQTVKQWFDDKPQAWSVAEIVKL